VPDLALMGGFGFFGWKGKREKGKGKWESGREILNTQYSVLAFLRLRAVFIRFGVRILRTYLLRTSSRSECVLT
jgi:hypothetical protein